ncbi:hypothetical protein ACN4EK_07045 [Pantanalinema rosaneae CENA516]
MTKRLANLHSTTHARSLPQTGNSELPLFVQCALLTVGFLLLVALFP